MRAGAADRFDHSGNTSGRVGFEVYKRPFLYAFCFELFKGATKALLLMGSVFSFEVERLVEIYWDETKHLARRTVNETFGGVKVSQEGNQHAFPKLKAVAQAVANINLGAAVKGCRKVIPDIVMPTFPFIKTRVSPNGFR